MVTFLAPNTFSNVDVFPSFLTINFFIHYKDPTKQPQKIVEFVTYTLTSTFIAILLKCGLDANFKVQNDSTVGKKNFLTQVKCSSSN
jgi:lipoate-protein ligase A